MVMLEKTGAKDKDLLSREVSRKQKTKLSSKETKIREEQRWTGDSSVGECVPFRCEALGSILA